MGKGTSWTSDHNKFVPLWLSIHCQKALRRAGAPGLVLAAKSVALSGDMSTLSV